MEKEAFTSAILGMTDTLYRVAATQLRQRADQEDAVQECLRRAWEKRHKLREERYVQTWVIRILLNECHRMQRRMNRTLPAEEIPAAHRDERGELKDALLRVEERFRTPMVLHYIEGYGIAETAAMLRIPQGTVKSRLARGRKQLKEILDEEAFEE
ncbi:MAG: sigma-70 family RNA polymerase sigma factor [Clostridia bacterium]|nr:sigma-70 family RNA polymerase sigma factor [Clostridia bacterium]